MIEEACSNIIEAYKFFHPFSYKQSFTMFMLYHINCYSSWLYTLFSFHVSVHLFIDILHELFNIHFTHHICAYVYKSIIFTFCVLTGQYKQESVHASKRLFIVKFTLSFSFLLSTR